MNIYLDENSYIKVDGDGYCNSKCYEGALGFIVELFFRHEGNKSKIGRSALKIPRLLADTAKENAYIAEVISVEKDTVSDVFTDDNAKEGLLEGIFAYHDILKKRIHTADSDSEDAKMFDNCIIAVQFKKGMKPRFCAVSVDDVEGVHRVYPDGVDCPAKDKNIFDAIVKESSKDAAPFKYSVVVKEFLKKGSIGDTDCYEVKKTEDYLKEDYSGEVWYFCVDSVVYHWGTKTLQESISNNLFTQWSFIDHIVLAKRSLLGLNSLHSRGYLHTDLRPANIMCIGDEKSPESYRLIDYAGYNIVTSPGQITDGPLNDGYTYSVGPTVGSERASVFYAPERRHGVEKEDADIALVINHDDSYLIHFGWRSKLVGNDNIINEKLTQVLSEIDFNDEYHVDDEYSAVLPGDRLQFREYVFDIQNISEFELALNKETYVGTVYRCSKHFWKIFHGKIVVYSEEEFPQDWISIPRYIELRQWSVATDIFGVGSIFLYTIFNASKYDVKNESKYQRLLDEIENPNYLNRTWYDLSSLVSKLDAIFDDESSDIQAELNKRFHIEQKSSKHDGQVKSVSEFAKYLVKNITYAVPGAKQILINLKYNYIYFLYAIHFSMCCLHRERSLSNKENIYKDFIKPFCNNRLLSTQEMYFSSSDAYSRVDYMRIMVESSRYAKVEMDKEEIKDLPEDITPSHLRTLVRGLEDQLREISDVVTESKVALDKLKYKPFLHKKKALDALSLVEAIAREDDERQKQ